MCTLWLNIVHNCGSLDNNRKEFTVWSWIKPWDDWKRDGRRQDAEGKCWEVQMKAFRDSGTERKWSLGSTSLLCIRAYGSSWNKPPLWRTDHWESDYHLTKKRKYFCPLYLSFCSQETYYTPVCPPHCDRTESPVRLSLHTWGTTPHMNSIHQEAIACQTSRCSDRNICSVSQRRWICLLWESSESFHHWSGWRCWLSVWGLFESGESSQHVTDN